MHIKKLDIKGFGKISSLELDLSKGLNIIYGPNESGKSTIQAFIKGMLFGLKGGREGKDGALPPLKKYKPWSDGYYGGALEYELDNGETYRIERNFGNGTVSVYDNLLNDVTGTFPASRSKGIRFAEKHLGLNEVCFEKTIFIRQMQSIIGEDGGKELLNRLSNITESGFEDVSFKNAEKALKEALITYVGTDRTSARPLDIVLDRLHELKRLKTRLIEKRNSIFTAEENLREAIDAKRKLDIQKTVLSNVIELVGIKKEAERLRKQAAGLKEVSDDILQAEKKAGQLSLRPMRLKSSKKTPMTYVAGIFAALAAVFTMLGAARAVWGYIAALASLLAASAALLLSRRHTSGTSRHDALMRELINTNNDIKDMYSRAASIWGRPFKNAEEILNVAHESAKMHETMNGKLRAGILSLNNEEYTSISIINDGLLEKRLSEAELKDVELWCESERKRLDDECNDILLKIREYETLIKSAASDDDLIQRTEEEIADLELKSAELEELGFSLRTALELLTAASTEISRDYIPRLSDRMSSIINNISGGKYSRLGADDRLLLKVIAPETGELTAASLLSGGTTDQVYLALRIAAADIIAPQGEALPLVMDEVFAQYDDTRTANALRFLNGFSSDRQVIFFTCKAREVDIAAQACTDRANIIRI